MLFNQHEYTIRSEWGLRGTQELAPISDVVIIVDILSFSTSVDVATARGALVYPYQWKDDTAVAYATSLGAELAHSHRAASTGYTLSPASLLGITPNTKLVLPSPNGSTLSLATGNTPTICGSIRNAKAVAEYAMSIGTTIAVIPAGERWPDGTLRVAIEDMIGAGAIIAHLQGERSPESKAAERVFESVQKNMLTELQSCSSGKELLARGCGPDIEIACALNASVNVPVLRDGCYRGVI